MFVASTNLAIERMWRCARCAIGKCINASSQVKIDIWDAVSIRLAPRGLINGIDAVWVNQTSRALKRSYIPPWTSYHRAAATACPEGLLEQSYTP